MLHYKQQLFAYQLNSSFVVKYWNIISNDKNIEYILIQSVNYNILLTYAVNCFFSQQESWSSLETQSVSWMKACLRTGDRLRRDALLFTLR